MNEEAIRKRIEAAHKLLTAETTNRQKFESVRTLLNGINPSIDRWLYDCSKTLTEFEKLQKGEVIELTVENLPEFTEEDRKRKKALLLFIKNWRELNGEVDRLQKEFSESGKDNRVEQVSRIGKIVTFAKGPFGLVTLAALAITCILIFARQNSPTLLPIATPSPATQSQTIQAIVFADTHIPLDELRIGIGPECVSGTTEAPHYHAKRNEVVRSVDGVTLTDPATGGCGFGRVDEVAIIEIARY